MIYNCDFLYLSLILLGFVSVCFFSRRQFPSLQNRVFGVALIASMADILLDIIGSFMMINVFTVPVWLTMLVNSLFYTLQIVFPVIMLLYVIIVTDNQKRLTRPWIALGLWPAVITQLLVLVNPVCRTIFYVDPALGYVHAPFFVTIYINSFLYLAASLYVIIRFRKNVTMAERCTILAFLGMITGAVGLQYLMPSLLLSGAAIALSITLMYIIMQKPENMLDAVTGAFNRSALITFLQSSIDYRRPCHIVIVDMLYMRRINRLLGIRFGNSVLRSVSRKLQACGKRGWVFRNISNEFVICLPTMSDYERAYQSACRVFDGDFDIDGTVMSLTATICGLPDVSRLKTAEVMNECFENILASVPRGSRQVISADELSMETRREAVEEALYEALDKNLLSIELQPIYSVGSGLYENAETLARFNHRTLGSIPPSEFVEIAEKNGLILKLDELIVRKACEFIKRHEPLSSLGLRSIEVNLSAVEFMNEQFGKRLIDIVDEYGIDPKSILFEITETAASAEFDILSNGMGQMVEKGLRFVLDDFGTGYSNISRLMRLPFVAVKLDRSMMLAGLRDENSELVLLHNINMFRDLKMSTVIEGVETEKQAEAMRALGADFIQGFYYARPMPPDEFVKFCMERRAKSG